MFPYFWDGLYHFLAGLVLVGVYSRFSQGGSKRNWLFWIGFILSSSSLFFLPQNPSFLPRGLQVPYRLFHFPISDWDILLLGSRWHRFFLTHSFLPAWLFLRAISRGSALRCFAIGLAIGLASHLLWDGLSGSAMTAVVFLPGKMTITGLLASVLLIVNGFLVLFATKKSLG